MRCLTLGRGITWRLKQKPILTLKLLLIAMTMRRTERPIKTVSMGCSGIWKWGGGSCVASPSANEHRFGLSQAAVSCASRNRNRNLNWLIKTSKKRVARQLNKRPDDVGLPPPRPRSDSSRLTNTSAPAGYGSCPWRPVALHLIWGH